MTDHCEHLKAGPVGPILAAEMAVGYAQEFQKSQQRKMRRKKGGRGVEKKWGMICHEDESSPSWLENGMSFSALCFWSQVDQVAERGRALGQW